MPRSRTDRRASGQPSHERFLEGVDVRFRSAAILCRRNVAVLDDLGGFDNTSYLQRSLVRRYILLEARIEATEAAQVEGEDPPMSIPEYLQAINTLTGLIGKLGLKRRAKQVGLGEYLESKK